MGGALSAPALSYLLSGCETKTAATETAADGTLTDRHRQMVAALAEVIIPTTDTPGAKAAGVPDFITMMLRECYPASDRVMFARGLDVLADRSEETIDKEFLMATAEEQATLLRTMVGSDEEEDKSFFRLLKELTVLGFFTSEIGATQVLNYVHVPGRYEGCTPLEAGQKTWES